MRRDVASRAACSQHLTEEPVDGSQTGSSRMDHATVLATGAALDTSAAAALGIGLTGLGAALAQGRAVAAALEGTTRNPGTLSNTRNLMILGLGMIESVLVLVVVFLLTKM